MIKFKAHDESGKPIFGFGLSDRNLEKLREDKPIVVDLAEMGGDGELMIFWGRTEQEMFDRLKNSGVLPPECEINEQTESHENAWKEKS